MGATNVWTYTLTNSSLSVATASDPVTLNEGQGVTITASVVSNPIDGVTITAGSGGDIAEIVISKS